MRRRIAWYLVATRRDSDPALAALVQSEPESWGIDEHAMIYLVVDWLASFATGNAGLITLCQGTAPRQLSRTVDGHLRPAGVGARRCQLAVPSQQGTPVLLPSRRSGRTRRRIASIQIHRMVAMSAQPAIR